MEENERLKRLLKNYGEEEEHVLEAENKKLEDKEKLKTELKKASDAPSKAQNDVMKMKMQSERLSKEYDRLLREHSGLQDRAGKDKKCLWTLWKKIVNIPCQEEKFVIMLASRKFKIQFRKTYYDQPLFF